MTKRFILWDPKDGGPRLDEEGKIVSDGVLGRLGEGNVYLTTYGEYPDDRRPKDLDIGERIAGVRYSLSKSSGIYDIYRVT